MTRDHFAKEDLVLDFDASYVQQVIDAFVHIEFFREDCGVFVFDRVLAFEPAREIHRHEPAGDVTRQPERSADRPEHFFSRRTRLGAEFFKPRADAPPMVRFFFFDLLDPRFFGRFSQRLPMSSIGKTSGKLARIGILKNADQILACSVQTL